MQVASEINAEQKPQAAVPVRESLRLDALTSLRFFAAFMIVLLHFDQMILQGNRTFLSTQLALQQGVSFFFVLSGFILYYRYPVLPTAASCKKFFVARFARIYPAHIISMLLFMLVVPAQIWCTAGNRTVWLFAASATLIQSFIPSLQYFYAINVPAWSISTEFAFYLLFPLLIYRWRKTRLWKAAACVAIVAACLLISESLGTKTLVRNAGQFQMWLLYINPLVRLIEFVTGMLTANLFLSLRTKWNPAPFAITSLQTISLALVGASIFFLKSHSPVLPADQIPHALTYWAEGSGGFLAYALLIFSMSFSSGAVAKLLAQPWLVFLGEVSFSIYLLHWMVIDLMLVQMTNRMLNLSSYGLAGVYLGTILVASILMHLFAEKPLRKLITNALSPDSTRSGKDLSLSIAEAKSFYQNDVASETSFPVGKV